MNASGFDVVRMDASLGVAVCGNVFVTQFYAPATVELLEELRVLHSHVARQSPCVIFTLLDPTISREMPKEARQKAAEVAKEMEPFTVASAFVVFGEGFMGAIARSVLASVQMFSNPKHPWKVVSDIDAGIAWSVGQLATAGHTVDMPAFRAACQAVLTRGASTKP